MKPYFAKDNVLRGMFELCHKLFDVRYLRTNQFRAMCHGMMMFHFDVCDATLNISPLLLDPFARVENKRGGAWMDVVLSRNDSIKPIANLV